MPHIVKTATMSLNITADGLAGILIKINIAQDALRMAGVIDLPNICLCPAVKLVACVRLLEKHKIDIPSEIRKIMPAKKLDDLSSELLGLIFASAFADVVKDIRDHDRIFGSGVDLLEGFKMERILFASRRVFGMTCRRFCSVVHDRISHLLLGVPIEWTALANLLGYGQSYYAAEFVMGGNELSHAIAQCPVKFPFSKRVQDRVLHQVLDNITLSFGSGVLDCDSLAADFFLRWTATDLQLHSMHVSQRDAYYTTKNLLPYLSRITKVFMVIDPMQTIHDDSEDDTVHLTVDRTDNTASRYPLALLSIMFPQLKDLTVCVGVSPLNAAFSVPASEAVEQAVAALCAISVKRMSILTSDIIGSSDRWYPDAMEYIDTTGMTEDEILVGLLAEDVPWNWVFVVADE